MNGALTKQAFSILAMDKWSREVNIQATPINFIYVYQLPDAYGIEDLQYLLLD